MPNIGGPELIAILAVILLLFGASRLPLLGRNLGQGIKEFKKGVKEIGSDNGDKAETSKAGTTAAPQRETETEPKPAADRRD